MGTCPGESLPPGPRQRALLRQGAAEPAPAAARRFLFFPAAFRRTAESRREKQEAGCSSRFRNKPYMDFSPLIVDEKNVMSS